ncbi:hypothetical protein [Cylindrospermum sp. FACHB-282]|uniref:hypothetical protein n=1 Tax=Cylindrospermum sp. FACHB-282 TaxID=2692794 RepID=UPI0016883B8F|nr:hypothetical protein [Cylindrospermum sp. FACHB-282]MBD2386799.1 hypothetical protein [Cylindrospermum sp. FACHB-282]
MIKNIEILKKIWRERCELIKNNETGDYSRHLLLILQDLHEEIYVNKDHFAKSQYGKKFFEISLCNYCVFFTNTKDNQGQGFDLPTQKELNKLKRDWAAKVNQELSFIVETLSKDNKTGGKFKLEDFLILIRNIENKLTSVKNFELTLKLLYKQLLESKPDDQQIQFLVDTIILLFNRKGILSIEDILDSQFEDFKDINQDYLIPRVWGSPSQNQKSSDEYREELKLYYENLSFEQRLYFLNKIYCQDPQKYQVIFWIKGIQFENKFNIGNVYFYSPKRHGKKIKNEDNLDDCLQKWENKSHYCVAIDIQGIDSKFMAIRAKQMAERTIAALSTRKMKEQPIILSDDFLICDITGKIQDFKFKGRRDNTIINEENSIETQNQRLRIGSWISSETICHPTVEKWFTSIDLYRQASESLQSSQELLNSWFAIEKFSADSGVVSTRLPNLSTDLKKLNIKLFLETIDLWVGNDDAIKTVQLLLVFSELRIFLHKEARNALIEFTRPIILSNQLPKFFVEEYISDPNQPSLVEYISSDLLNYFYNDVELSIEKFVEKLPAIKKELEKHDKKIPTYLETCYEVYYNPLDCEKYILEKIFEIKSNIYNIYRIRNMLVHSSNTQSKLLDYYSKRSREYCFALLNSIGYRICTTSDDAEIMSLEFYFREIIIDANIALEAVKDKKTMDKFRKWALS